MTRTEELMAKARTGSMTPAEKQEMASLASSKPTATGVNAIGANPAILTMTPEQMAADEAKKAQGAIANINGPQEKKGVEATTPAPAMKVDKNKILEDWDTGAKTSVAQNIADKGKVDQTVARKLEDLAANKYVGPPQEENLDDQNLANMRESQHNSATLKTTDTTEKLPAFPNTQSPTEPVKPVSVPVNEVKPKTLATSFTLEPTKAVTTQKETTEKIPDVVSEKDKKSGFGDKLKELAVKYGLPMLAILEAVGYQRGGINKPTNLDKKLEAVMEQKQQEYVNNLENARLASQAAVQEKATKQDQEFTANQNELNRIAEKQKLGQELTSREKLALLQYKPAPKSVSLIPE